MLRSLLSIPLILLKLELSLTSQKSVSLPSLELRFLVDALFGAGFVGVLNTGDFDFLMLTFVLGMLSLPMLTLDLGLLTLMLTFADLDDVSEVDLLGTVLSLLGRGDKSGGGGPPSSSSSVSARLFLANSLAFCNRGEFADLCLGPDSGSD
jgi:hypothetical protein